MMIANDLINNTITPLNSGDCGLIALHWFDEYKVSHLPVIDQMQLIGVLSEEEIFALGDFDEAVGNYLRLMKNVSIWPSRHIYEVMKLFCDYKLTTLPVVDENNNYLGIITLNTLVEKIATVAAINNPGGILVLEMNVNDFSMVEISKIIEENDARILSVYVTSPADSTRLELTLKLNKIDIQPVVQAFQRHNYSIKASFFESTYFDSLRDRYDLLMNFLNI